MTPTVMLSALFLFGCLAPTTAYYYTVTYNEADESPPEPPHRPLLGTSPCTYGPSYWCHNITQASTCSAVPHCIRTSWSSTAPPLPPDNDDVCQICKEMVKEARDQLLSNQTQADIKAVLDGSCALIPLSPVAKECAALMDNFIPELIDALASRMDPQLVCKVSGLCNSERIDKLLQENQLSCRTCSYYIEKTLNYLNDTEKLKNSLLEECGHLGSYSDSCTAAVLTDFNTISGFLSRSEAVEFCQLIGICRESANTTELSLYTPTEDLSCDFCKQLVTHLRDWLVENSTREEFDLVIKNICKKSGKYEKECEDFFVQYSDEVWRLIVDDLDPEGFCGRVGVCPGQGKQQTSPIWTILSLPETPLTKLTPPETLIGPLKNTTTKNQTLIGPLSSTTPTCELCSFITAQLQNYLEEPETEKNIETWIDSVCNRHLPKELASQCEEFVDVYGDALVQLVGEEVGSGEICPRLRLCPPKNKPQTVLPTCALCQFTVTKLINLIGRNRTKESIDSATSRVCHALPKRYTIECLDFMKSYGDQVIEMILIDGSSHEICAAIHLCLFGKQQQQISVGSLLLPGPAVTGKEEERTKDNPKCVLCEYVIQTLAERIKDNATEEEIKSELDQICSHLPKTITQKCTDFVDAYGDMVLRYLAQEMDPSAVCKELKLCGKEGVGEELSLITPCQLCTVIRDYYAVKLNDTEFIRLGPVEGGVTRLCGHLRGLRGRCTAMIEDYGDYLYRLVEEGEVGGDACGVLGVC